MVSSSRNKEVSTMSDAASNQKCSSWQDLALADDKIERLNKITDATFVITHCAQTTNQNMALDYLNVDSHIVLLGAEKVIGSIIFCIMSKRFLEASGRTLNPRLA